MVFADRWFDWKSVEIEKIQSDSHGISFEDEWEKFSSLVADATHDGKANKQTLPTANEVLENHFQSVMTNTGHLYASHESFSNALFEALRNSLDGFACPPGNRSNLIVLQSTWMNVGFGRDVHRTKLGFKKEYGLSMDSRPDHGCFVFGPKFTT